MRRLLLSILMYVSAGQVLSADDAPSLSKADQAFLAVVASGKPIPKSAPLFIGFGYVGRLDRVYVVQVLDDRNAVVFVGGSDYVLRGQSTSRMRQFESFSLPQPHVAIIETAVCESPWGTKRTLPAMDIVNIDEILAALVERE